MVYDIYETKEDSPEEPTDPNKVRLALAFLFNSQGTLDFEDSVWTIDFDGENGRIEFIDENNNTVAYIPTGTDGDITGGSSSDTRVDVADDGTTIVTDTEEIDFSANVSVTDNGDGTVTVDATDTDTHTNVSDDGTTTVSDTSDINFRDLLTVTDDGDGSVTVDGTDTHTSVSDSGTTVVSDTSDINFASFLSVTDDGDGSVTVDGSDETIRTRQANIPLTEIADTNTAVGLRKLVPSGKTLRILEVGVEDDTGSAPTGLTIEVRDLTNATNIVSQNTRHNEGSPIASKSGAIDVAFRVNNGTGGSVNASGYVLYTME